MYISSIQNKAFSRQQIIIRVYHMYIHSQVFGDSKIIRAFPTTQGVYVSNPHIVRRSAVVEVKLSKQQLTKKLISQTIMENLKMITRKKD